MGAGWNLHGYAPRRAKPLRDALAAAGGVTSDYGRAFRWIVGEDYTPELWEAVFGPAWAEVLGEDWRRHPAHPTRRRSGRRKGDAREPVASAVSLPAAAPPAAEDGEPDEHGAAVARLLELLSGGAELADAIADPAVTGAVRAWAADPANRPTLAAVLADGGPGGGGGPDGPAR